MAIEIKKVTDCKGDPRSFDEKEIVDQYQADTDSLHGDGVFKVKSDGQVVKTNFATVVVDAPTRKIGVKDGLGLVDGFRIGNTVLDGQVKETAYVDAPDANPRVDAVCIKPWTNPVGKKCRVPEFLVEIVKGTASADIDLTNDVLVKRLAKKLISVNSGKFIVAAVKVPAAGSISVVDCRDYLIDVDELDAKYQHKVHRLNKKCQDVYSMISTLNSRVDALEEGGSGSGVLPFHKENNIDFSTGIDEALSSHYVVEGNRLYPEVTVGESVLTDIVDLDCDYTGEDGQNFLEVNFGVGPASLASKVLGDPRYITDGSRDASFVYDESGSQWVMTTPGFGSYESSMGWSSLDAGTSTKDSYPNDPGTENALVNSKVVSIPSVIDGNFGGSFDLFMRGNSVIGDPGTPSDYCESLIYTSFSMGIDPMTEQVTFGVNISESWGLWVTTPEGAQMAQFYFKDPASVIPNATLFDNHSAGNSYQFALPYASVLGKSLKVQHRLSSSSGAGYDQIVFEVIDVGTSTVLISQVYSKMTVVVCMYQDLFDYLTGLVGSKQMNFDNVFAANGIWAGDNFAEFKFGEYKYSAGVVGSAVYDQTLVVVTNELESVDDIVTIASALKKYAAPSGWDVKLYYSYEDPISWVLFDTLAESADAVSVAKRLDIGTSFDPKVNAGLRMKIEMIPTSPMSTAFIEGWKVLTDNVTSQADTEAFVDSIANLDPLTATAADIINAVKALLPS